MASLNFRSSLRATTLIALTLSSLSAWSRTGVEAAQLDYVALDASVDCNRILFQSSQHFKRTLFVIPRVVPGAGVEGARTYNITPSDKPGIYDLAIHLYFPANDEAIKATGASSTKRDLLACNWDQVKSSINRNIQDPTQHIQTISRIPLTSVDVRIPGIENVAMIGRSLTANENPDILDYYGKALTAIFKVTEKEKIAFQSQLVSNQGIPAVITFRFQARSRDGSVTAKINTANLVQNFNAQAGVKGMKVIASADLAIAVKNSLNESSIQITTESGSSDALPKITEMILEKILKEASLVPQTEEVKSAKLPGDGAAPGKGMISIQAALDILQNKVKSEFTYNLIAAPEAATAQTEIRLMADRLNDPNVSEVKISAGYQASSVGMSIRAGETIVINPAYWMTDKITYEETKKYLSNSEIQTLNLSSLFPDLVNKNVVVHNIDVNGNIMAEGAWRPFVSINMGSPYKIRWARVTRQPVRERVESNTFPSGVEGLSEIGVGLSFSELGDSRAFKLSDLLEENPYWNAQYDKMTGRIFLTAIRDLGAIRFRSRMNGTDNVAYQPVVLDQVLQLKMSPFGGTQYTDQKVLKSDGKAIVLQKSIVLYVRTPQKMDVNAIITGRAKLKETIILNNTP